MRISERLGDQLIDMQVPEPSPREAILRAHTAEYIRRLFEGDLTSKEIRRVGLPWSPQIVRRTRYSVGASGGGYHGRRLCARNAGHRRHSLSNYRNSPGIVTVHGVAKSDALHTT